jgi:hypothetical protein
MSGRLRRKIEILEKAAAEKIFNQMAKALLLLIFDAKELETSTMIDR